MNAADATALRATYLLAFDDFSTDPTAVADLPEVGNVRYARELLGTLVHAGLVVEHWVNGEDQVWQAAVTYDDQTSEDAVALIDEWLTDNGAVEVLQEGTTVTQAAPRRRSTRSVSGVTDCLCGCGIKVGGKAAYRPGHDARHASQVAKAILGGQPASVLNSLPSASLRAKAQAQVERGNSGGATKKASPKAPKAPRHSLIGQPAWVKVGRWVKPAEVTSITVDGKGRETADSEVCTVQYQDSKGGLVQVQVDTAKMVRGTNWDLGDVPAS